MTRDNGLLGNLCLSVLRPPGCLHDAVQVVNVPTTSFLMFPISPIARAERPGSNGLLGGISHLFEPSDEWASTGDSNAMNSTHGADALQEALCGALAGP